LQSAITVVFGGPSPEHDISILTGLQCERVLRRRGDVSLNAVYWDRTGNWFSVPSDTEARDYIDGPPPQSKELEFRVGRPGGWFHTGLRRRPLETGVVLNCCHGGLGEGGGAQALFALAGLPSTGASVAAACLGMDKHAFSTVVRSAAVPALPRELLTEFSEHSIEGPIIVKPRFGGSSIGIEIVDSVPTARALLSNSVHLRDGAVIEPYRADLYDVNISYRTYPQFELSEIERPIRGQGGQVGAIYTFEEKYLNEAGLHGAARELPAKLAPGVADRVAEYARRIHDVTRISGIVRIDFLSDGSELYVNEVNSIPGAMALYLWQNRPVDRLLLDGLEEARRAFTDPVAAQSGSRTAALQAAGGISAKLAGLQSESR
jgi:D-alanine-D-alanine ligase